MQKLFDIFGNDFRIIYHGIGTAVLFLPVHLKFAV
jgi:hypothetical protein